MTGIWVWWAFDGPHCQQTESWRPRRPHASLLIYPPGPPSLPPDPPPRHPPLPPSRPRPLLIGTRSDWPMEVWCARTAARYVNHWLFVASPSLSHLKSLERRRCVWRGCARWGLLCIERYRTERCGNLSTLNVFVSSSSFLWLDDLSFGFMLFQQRRCGIAYFLLKCCKCFWSDFM